MSLDVTRGRHHAEIAAGAAVIRVKLFIRLEYCQVNLGLV
jgi:hypothetical protein